MSEELSRLPPNAWKPPDPVDKLPPPDQHAEGDLINFQNQECFILVDGKWSLMFRVPLSRDDFRNATDLI